MHSIRSQSSPAALGTRVGSPTPARLLRWILIGALMPILSSPPALAQSPPSPPSEAPQALTICYYPTEFFFEQNGDRFTGLEYDILNRFAETYGYKTQFRTPGHLIELFAALQDGRCDIVAATVTWTEERAKIMDFSPAYFPVRILAVEPQDSLTSRPEQLRGKTAAVHRGSSYIEALDAIGDVKKLWTDDVEPSFAAVSQGEADFMACDSAFVLELIGDYPNLRITIPLSDRQYFAFALSKDSPLTAPLGKLMHRLYADGEIRRFLARYYDPDGVDLILQDFPEP